MIPDNVEKIIMTKEDYDRNVEQLLLEKIELQKRIDKAIEYMEDEEVNIDDINGLFNHYDNVEKILKGEDKE